LIRGSRMARTVTPSWIVWRARSMRSPTPMRVQPPSWLDTSRVLPPRSPPSAT
jgi:hypothetical protein